MRQSVLHDIGSANYERLGSARHSAELRQMAGDRSELIDTGRLRLRLQQCGNCLAARPLSIAACPRCEVVQPGGSR